MSLDPNFTGAGRTITDSAGRYHFRTIKPAAYPGDLGSLFRPAHIHTSLFGPLLSQRLVTQCYFEGDPLQDRDPILQSIPDPRACSGCSRASTPADEVGDIDSALAYDWDIVLRARARRRWRTTTERSRRARRPARGVPSPSQTMGPLYGFALMFDGSDRRSPPKPWCRAYRGLVLDGDGVPLPGRRATSRSGRESRCACAHR